MTVTRVSRTKRSSDCAVGTLEFEFKEDSRNGRVSDWLRKIKWSIIKRAKPYPGKPSRCNLCLAERLCILTADKSVLLNKRSELITKCRHENKFYAANQKPDRYDYPPFKEDKSSNSNVPNAQSDDRLVRETRVTVILIFYLCTICISALHVSSTPEIL